MSTLAPGCGAQGSHPTRLHLTLRVLSLPPSSNSLTMGEHVFEAGSHFNLHLLYVVPRMPFLSHSFDSFPHSLVCSFDNSPTFPGKLPDRQEHVVRHAVFLINILLSLYPFNSSHLIYNQMQQREVGPSLRSGEWPGDRHTSFLVGHTRPPRLRKSSGQNRAAAWLLLR